MRSFLLPLSLILILSSGFSQPYTPDIDVFVERREAFMESLEPDGYAIFPSAPVHQRNKGVDYPFRQESNFYYLSGFEEPGSILLINPSAPRYRTVMFVRERDPRQETWDGPRAGTEGAISIFGADTALVTEDFESSARSFINSNGPLYYTFGINDDTDEVIKKICVGRWVGYNCTIIDPTDILIDMRFIKTDDDLREGLERAIDITAQAHIEAMKAIKPGKYELEIQGTFESVFRRLGSVRNGFPCIIGSGPNSCILHYSKNSRRMEDGELVLMDCGAEYGYYSADITRTVPVNGTFSREQRRIYELVLEAQQAGIEHVKPGVSRSFLDSVITSVLAGGLIDLGFIRERKHSRLFSLHGYMHWLGLDTHDVGRYRENGGSITLRQGMVFTIEPGIYVREEVLEALRRRDYSEEEVQEIRERITPYLNIGVRIEDDILVTQSGYRNLSAGAPRNIEEIERLMGMGATSDSR